MHIFKKFLMLLSVPSFSIPEKQHEIARTLLAILFHVEVKFDGE